MRGKGILIFKDSLSDDTHDDEESQIGESPRSDHDPLQTIPRSLYWTGGQKVVDNSRGPDYPHGLRTVSGHSKELISIEITQQKELTIKSIII